MKFTAEERAEMTKIVILMEKADRVLSRLTKLIRDSENPDTMDRVLSRIDAAIDSMEQES